MGTGDIVSVASEYLENIAGCDESSLQSGTQEGKLREKSVSLRGMDRRYRSFENSTSALATFL
jgi:hypothetical protein